MDQSEASKSKMAARGPKTANGVWNGVYSKVFGRSRQLSLNMFFDPSAPSMRKVDNGKRKKKRKEKKENNAVFGGH